MPALFKVSRIVRFKLIYAGCARLRHRAAPSIAVWPGRGLLPHVLVSNFADHLPLYRQVEIYERSGSSWTVPRWRTGWGK